MKLKYNDRPSGVSIVRLVLRKLQYVKTRIVHSLVRKKSIFFILFVLLLIVSFTFGVIAQRNYGFSNMFAKPIILDAVGIIKRQILSNFENPETIYIDIDYKNYMKLQHRRQKALNKGTMHGIENDWVKAKIRNGGKSYKAKLRLKGATADQHMDTEKWSFKLKLKEKKTIFGMREFAFMSPMRRNLLGQWFLRKVYEKEGLISRKYKFVQVVVNGKEKGVYVIDERYDKIMLERNYRKEGPVIKIDQTPLFVDKVNSNIDRDNYFLSMDYTAFNLKKFMKDEVLRNQFLNAKELMENFRLGQLSTSDVFDIELLAKWTALSDVFGAWHGFSFANMRFYYNPVIAKFEPVPDDDYNERAYNYASELRNFRLNDRYNDSTFLRNLFSDHDFVKLYIQELVKFSNDSYLDELFVEFNDEIETLSNILATDYPLYNFLLDTKNYTYDNAHSLRNKLTVHKGIQAYLINSKSENKIELAIANNQTVPMEILYLSYNGSAGVFKPSIGESIVIDGRKFMQPVSYSLQKFQLLNGTVPADFDSSKLEVSYRILGTENIVSTKIFPYKYTKNIYPFTDIIREKPNLGDFQFLTVDGKNKEVHFEKGNWSISQDLIIPKDYTVYISEGVNINLVNSAMILSYSPLLIVGSESNFINIGSSDGTGQGITVLNAKKESLIKYVQFKSLSRPSKLRWALSGAINFYQSPVHFFESHFDKNLVGDDYLNIIRSDFSINNSRFVNSFSDTVDVDFSKGTIANSVFVNCGFGDNNGDCIDFSGSVIEMNNLMINNVADKGVSVGENSVVKIENIDIKRANIAIAGKDLSQVNVEKAFISSSKTGIMVYQKKPEFGPAKVFIDELHINQVDTPYSVQKSSFLSVDSTVID